MEYNSDGMEKFVSTSFTAFYNQDHFKHERIPYRINDMSAYYAFDEISLNLDGSEDFYGGYLNVSTIVGIPRPDLDEAITTEQIGENPFRIARELVKVRDSAGVVTEKEMITGLLHHSSICPELYTTIDFRSFSLGGEEYIFSESDLQTVNETFALLMSTFEVDLSPELQKEYDEWWGEHGENIENYGPDMAQQLDKSAVYDTQKGFTVNYPIWDCDVLSSATSTYLIPWVEANQSNHNLQDTTKEPDTPIGIHVDSKKSGNIIRFLSYDGTEPVPSEQFFYPAEMEKLERDSKELQYSEETVQINGETFTVGSTRYPRGVAFDFEDGEIDYVATQYHYTENGKSYVMYSLTSMGDPEDIVIETMEFMCFTLEVTD